MPHPANDADPTVERSAAWLPVVAIGLRAVLLALALGLLVLPDVPWLHGKAMVGRAVFYPLGALVLPVGWWLVSRRRGVAGPYPWAADALLTLPFVTDLLGNYANLFDRVAWFDDVMHAVNWFFLTAGIGLLLPRPRLGRAVSVGLMLGIAAVPAILWELLEYVAFIRFSPELATAYVDTLFDQTMDLTGATLATILLVGPFWPSPEPQPIPAQAEPHDPGPARDDHTASIASA